LTGLNVIFMGTSFFAIPSLERLLQGGFQLMGVVTRPDRRAGRGKKLSVSPVKEKALQSGTALFQPVGAEELLEILQQFNPDVLVNVAYGMILPRPILQLPPLGSINLHPSLLPAYRGAAPLQRALMAGEKITGVTVMHMSTRLDAGDIILQEKMSIGPEENYGSLHNRLAEAGGILLEKALTLLAKGEAPRCPQDEKMVTFAPPLSHEEERIRWPDSARAIFNQIRALDPAPGAYTFYRNRRLKIWRAMVAEDTAGNFKGHFKREPGTVMTVNKNFFEVVTGKGILTVYELQQEGKNRMQAAQFLRGNDLGVGERFA
jgi:methionyl-tRNA formyltransferase